MLLGTFLRFIADGFKNIFIHNKTSRISSLNNYIYLFGGALASKFRLRKRLENVILIIGSGAFLVQLFRVVT